MSEADVEAESLCENYFTTEDCNGVAGCIWVAEDYECESMQLAKARQFMPPGSMGGMMNCGPGCSVLQQGMECEGDEIGKSGLQQVIQLPQGVGSP